ncbi:MAG TPA: TROVE domain-containing protein [Candidatus Xenobia bacterium]|jgi:60 kDa SS-A/Ro ribonucleoprotein
MTNYAQHLNPAHTPQSEPLDARQVKNQAGGWVYAMSDMDRVRRFLILGSEGATYYASERKMVVENAQTVLRALTVDGPAVVRLATDMSVSGRAPKNDPAIFVLALAIRHGDDRTRAEAYAAVPQVCRIGTHLFTLMEYLKQLGKGESRGLRTVLQRWYLEKEPSALAWQAVKYQQRNGWSHRDVLRMAHPKHRELEGNAILHWVVKGWPDVENDPPERAGLRTIWAVERARRATAESEIVHLIETYRLPFEAIPTEWLKAAAVWSALIPHLGYTGLVRNLARMTANGTLAPLSGNVSKVVERLRDAEALRKGRVHPIQILSALKTYEQGKGERGSLTWTPVAAIVDVLNDVFYHVMDQVEPVGGPGAPGRFAAEGPEAGHRSCGGARDGAASSQRWFLGLDISGSMWSGTIAGVPGLTPAVATAAMAMVTMRQEPSVYCMAFTGTPVEVKLSARQRLDDVLKETQALSHQMGRTDCAVPMRYALTHHIPVDVFCIYTDNETCAGPIHPMEALRQYRRVTGIPARLMVVGMTATGFTIADPLDGGALDVVGFDSAAPTLMANFARGTV